MTDLTPAPERLLGHIVEWNPAGDEWKRATVCFEPNPTHLVIKLRENRQELLVERRHVRVPAAPSARDATNTGRRDTPEPEQAVDAATGLSAALVRAATAGIEKSLRTPREDWTPQGRAAAAAVLHELADHASGDRADELRGIAIALDHANTHQENP